MAKKLTTESLSAIFGKAKKYTDRKILPFDGFYNNGYANSAENPVSTKAGGIYFDVGYSNFAKRPIGVSFPVPQATPSGYNDAVGNDAAPATTKALPGKLFECKGIVYTYVMTREDGGGYLRRLTNVPALEFMLITGTSSGPEGIPLLHVDPNIGLTYTGRKYFELKEKGGKAYTPLGRLLNEGYNIWDSLNGLCLNTDNLYIEMTTRQLYRIQKSTTAGKYIPVPLENISIDITGSVSDDGPQVHFIESQKGVEGKAFSFDSSGFHLSGIEEALTFKAGDVLKLKDHAYECEFRLRRMDWNDNPMLVSDDCGYLIWISGTDIFAVNALWIATDCTLLYEVSSEMDSDGKYNYSLNVFLNKELRKYLLLSGYFMNCSMPSGRLTIGYGDPDTSGVQYYYHALGSGAFKELWHSEDTSPEFSQESFDTWDTTVQEAIKHAPRFLEISGALAVPALIEEYVTTECKWVNTITVRARDMWGKPLVSLTECNVFEMETKSPWSGSEVELEGKSLFDWLIS